MGPSKTKYGTFEELVNRRVNDGPPKTNLHPIAFIVNTLELVNVIAPDLEEWGRRGTPQGD